MEFTYIDGPEALAWSCINSRERFVSFYDALAASTLQRILQIATYRNNHSVAGKLMTPPECASHWKQNFRKSSSDVSEDVSGAFVEKALRLWDGVLSTPVVRQKVIYFDEVYGKQSPFNNMDSLKVLASKMQSDKDLGVWFFDSIHDMIHTGQMSVKDFSARQLSPGAGKGIGFLDLQTAKKAILQEMLTKLLPQNKFSSQEWGAVCTLRVAV